MCPVAGVEVDHGESNLALDIRPPFFEFDCAACGEHQGRVAANLSDCQRPPPRAASPPFLGWRRPLALAPPCAVLLPPFRCAAPLSPFRKKSGR